MGRWNAGLIITNFLAANYQVLERRIKISDLEIAKHSIQNFGKYYL